MPLLPLNDQNLPYPDTIHPVIVHFVIAMVFFAYFCDVVGCLNHNHRMFEVSWWNLAVASIVVFIAVIFSEFEAGLAQPYAVAQLALDWHTISGWSISVILVAITAWRGIIRVRDPLRVPVAYLGAATFLICLVYILVNNAGVDGKNAAFWNILEADYDAVLNINIKGTFFTTQAFVQHLIHTKRTGKIINISSTHKEVAFPHFTYYCASKGGVKMMMQNLAVELSPLGITINNIAPGAIKTPINTKLLHDPVKLDSLKRNIPLGRLGTPEDIAPMVTFLASSAADYITGATFFVDGGLIRNYHEQ